MGSLRYSLTFRNILGGNSIGMSRTSTLPKRLQPMLATLTDAPFDDRAGSSRTSTTAFGWSRKSGGKVTLYSRNGKIISHSYIEVAKALEGVKGDAVIDGELVAIEKDGISHFQLLQNALRHEAKLLYCAFDLMFENAVDLRGRTLLERKKRLKAILPRDKLIAFSRHRKTTERNSSPRPSGRALKASWRSAPTAPIVGKPHRGLAEDQDGKAAGSGHRRLHGPRGGPGHSSAPSSSPCARRDGATSDMSAPASATRPWKTSMPSS